MDNFFQSLANTSHLGVFGAMLEIIIIITMIYMTFSAIKGTRGAGIARGAVICFVILFIFILFIAKMVELRNVSWILENLVDVSLFGIVVIFQPEIRRMLIRIGESASQFAGKSDSNMEKEVVDAAFHISKRSEVGALIVIERKTMVGTCIESGVLLEARLSTKLLTTIFTKNTPLHDGAVIIRAGKIVAANCLLPLSENVEVCKGMGTRHRAALGLSEEVDAVVVIVSEETGAVSVAIGGEITLDLDYEGLTEVLVKECKITHNQNQPEKAED